MAVLQGRLGLLPEGAVVVGDSFAVVRSEGRLTCFNAGGPVFECSEEDHHGIRLACALAVELKLATAKVIGVNYFSRVATITFPASAISSERPISRLCWGSVPPSNPRGALRAAGGIKTAPPRRSPSALRVGGGARAPRRRGSCRR